MNMQITDTMYSLAFLFCYMEVLAPNKKQHFHMDQTEILRTIYSDQYNVWLFFSCPQQVIYKHYNDLLLSFLAQISPQVSLLK